MPIQSPKRNVSEAEQKLLLLFLLQLLEPVAAEPLWQFASGWKLLDDYIAFRLALHELEEDGEAARGEHALEEQLFLTERGREALRLFGDRVPASARDTARTHAEAFKRQQQRRREVSAVYETASRGAYTVLLGLNEGEVSTLRLRVRTDRQTVARDCMQRFAGAASALLGLCYLELPVAEADAPLREGFAVEAVSATEFLAHCRLPSAGHAQIELWLLFPTPESARAFVCGAQARAQTLAERLLRILRAGKAK